MIATVGVLVLAGFAWSLRRELDSLDVATPPVAVFLLGLALSVGVLSVAAWVAGSDRRRRPEPPRTNA